MVGAGCCSTTRSCPAHLLSLPSPSASSPTAHHVLVRNAAHRCPPSECHESWQLPPWAQILQIHDLIALPVAHSFLSPSQLALTSYRANTQFQPRPYHQRHSAVPPVLCLAAQPPQNLLQSYITLGTQVFDQYQYTNLVRIADWVTMAHARMMVHNSCQDLLSHSVSLATEAVILAATLQAAGTSANNHDTHMLPAAHQTRALVPSTLLAVGDCRHEELFMPHISAQDGVRLVEPAPSVLVFCRQAGGARRSRPDKGIFYAYRVLISHSAT